MISISASAKHSIAELGVFGGAPLFEEPVHVGRPNLPAYERVAERLRGIFERGWLTNQGPQVLEFEHQVADLTGVKHCIAVCNATVGLGVGMRALGMTGEVIVPSFTFAATVHALAWQGITPIFCDVDAVSHCLDPRQVEQLITERTSGIVGVHLWGRTCDVESLESIARARRIPLLFDAAHAFGCSHRGMPIGGNGSAEVFSFHATKFINTFEGGAIATNDANLAQRIRLMTNFGFEGYDHVVSIGTNGKMSEPCAAMGLASLERMSDIIAANRRNYAAYRRELRELPGVTLVEQDSREQSNYQYVVLEIDERTALPRDVLLEVLHGENILARRYFYPGVHRMEPYRTLYPSVGERLPHTTTLANRVLVLPTGASVGSVEIAQICGVIRLCVENAADIVPRLPQDKLSVARNLT